MRHTKSTLLALAGVAMTSAPLMAAFSPSNAMYGVRSQNEMTDFANFSGVTFVGDATINSKSHANDLDLELISAKHNQVGAVWTSDMKDLTQDWWVAIEFEFEKPGGIHTDAEGKIGADGMAMVFQNQANNIIGKKGGGLGYRGISGAIAIEIDTWMNPKWGDANGNHIAVTRGDMSEIARFDVPFELIDDQHHVLMVKSSNNILSMYLDDIAGPIIEIGMDFSVEFASTNGMAFAGLTAASGGASFAETEIESLKVSSPMYTVVPAPGSLALIGLGGLAATRRRR